jgi:hypothetical protein
MRGRKEKQATARGNAPRSAISQALDGGFRQLSSNADFSSPRSNTANGRAHRLLWSRGEGGGRGGEGARSAY